MGDLLLKLAVVVVVVIGFSSLPRSVPLPFAIFHGLGDTCDSAGINSTIVFLSKWSREKGFCVRIGNGRWDSLFMPLQKQTDIACEKVKKMKELKDGFNIVGFSQGNLIARGVIEFCDGAPQVNNFISIGGPHAGTAAAPVCKSSGYMCQIFNRIIKKGIYSAFVQNNLAPSGYIKTPTHESYYLEKSRFLPKLNNERFGERNATYIKNFSNLNNLILIMSESDSILKPPETSWFGYYLDGTFSVLYPYQTELYIEDWIGLRSLVRAGRAQFISVKGEHIRLTGHDFYEHVVPYLRA